MLNRIRHEIRWWRWSRHAPFDSGEFRDRLTRRSFQSLLFLVLTIILSVGALVLAVLRHRPVLAGLNAACITIEVLVLRRQFRLWRSLKRLKRPDY